MNRNNPPSKRNVTVLIPPAVEPEDPATEPEDGEDDPKAPAQDPENPKTADSSNMMLWMTVMLASALAALTFGLKNRKER